MSKKFKINMEELLMRVNVLKRFNLAMDYIENGLDSRKDEVLNTPSAIHGAWEYLVGSFLSE